MTDHDPNNPNCPVLIEMQALIKFCEVTDNAELRALVKRRLMYLSEIPYLEVKDIKHEDILSDKIKLTFTERAIDMIKDYLAGSTISEIREKHKTGASVTNYWLTKAFTLTEQQRLELIS